MPYNPQIATSRGAAGESDDTTAGRYNFANLYQLNRNDGADQQKDLAGFQNRAAKIGGTDERGNATGLYGEAMDAVRGNDQKEANAKIGEAVDQAKGLASDTQGYSVSGSLQKKGVTGAQNAAATFYAGSSGQDAAAQARQYGNIYQSMQNAQAGISGQVDRHAASNAAANGPDAPAATPLADPVAAAQNGTQHLSNTVTTNIQGKDVPDDAKIDAALSGAGSNNGIPDLSIVNGIVNWGGDAQRAGLTDADVNAYMKTAKPQDIRVVWSQAAAKRQAGDTRPQYAIFAQLMASIMANMKSNGKLNTDPSAPPSQSQITNRLVT